MTIFRMWVVDEYPFDDMWEQDFVMCYILVALNILITAVIFMNLMIALLSDSFQRIYDNAYAVALLQQAESIMGLEHFTLNVDSKLKFADWLDKDGRTKENKFDGGNPLQESYDDDASDDEEDDGYGDMKKASVRSVEILEEIKEKFIYEEEHGEELNISDSSRPKSAKNNTRTDVVSMNAKINTLTVQMNSLSRDYNKQNLNMQKIADQLSFISSRLRNTENK